MRHGLLRPRVPASHLSLETLTWVLVFGATFLTYLRALRGEFLWDDDAHVTSTALQSVEGLKHLWLRIGTTQQYYPFLYTAFWIEHRLWGNSVIGYHLINILFHATAACLVVSILRKLTCPGALLAGLIFALHPLNVESVAWISEQKNTLSGVFYLGSVLSYLGFDQSRNRREYWLALSLFALALLTKTVTATLPAVLLVIFWWQRGHLSWSRDIRPLFAWMLLGIAAGLFTAWLEQSLLIAANGTDYGLTIPQRCLVAGRVVWFYLGKLLWPANLMFTYPKWVVDTTSPWQDAFPLGILTVAPGMALLASKANGTLQRVAAAGLAGFLIFAGTLIPVMGFLNVYPFIYSYVADHFQYLASLGIIVPITAGLTLLTRRLPKDTGLVFQTLVPVGATFLLVTLGVLTWRQTGIYRDPETLYRATIAQNPSSWMSHNNLGAILMGQSGHSSEAVSEFEKALQLRPDYAEAHNNLGLALSGIRGRQYDAVSQFKEAFRIKPEYAQAHNNLGNVYSQIPENFYEGITQYEEAIRLSPNLAEFHGNLGLALSRAPGRLNEAITQYQEALRLSPDSAEIRDNLGVALAEMPGHMPEAIAQFKEALRLDPDYALIWRNLGASWYTMQNLPAAEEALRMALRLKPESAETHYLLGLVFARMPGRLDAAIAQFREAVQLSPNYHAAQRALMEASGRIATR